MLEIDFSAEQLILSPSSVPTTMFPNLPSTDSGLNKHFELNMSDYYNFNSSASDYEFSELWMRHSYAITSILCVAYSLIFVLGILGNSLVISVVFRSPRMWTVTNFFIANLAVADILVVIFCLPATLLANIFVRKYIIYYTVCFLFVLDSFQLNDTS